MQYKISFKNDYSEGAHPYVLEVLSQTNQQQQAGYGHDQISQHARSLIRSAIQREESSVFFVAGGTQANLLVISHLLRSYQSVIAVDSAHIHVHETGAIESAGHKINLVRHVDGKLNVTAIQELLNSHQDNHMVMPKMVYLSHCTELGTIYRKSELRDISQFCRSNGLLLFLDGARLGCALTADGNDLSLSDIADYCDVFYIGATKNGGLLGEAIVFPDPDLSTGFDFHLKQKGALLAKGRLLGAQFYALLETGLFFDLARHANGMAARLSQAFRDCGYAFAFPPVSNQIFPILPIDLIERLQEKYDFYRWQSMDDNRAVVRLVCSWATTKESVDRFIDDLTHQTPHRNIDSI